MACKVTKKVRKDIKALACIVVMFLCPVSAIFAQGQPQTEEEMDEEIMEMCEKAADELATAYDLEDWQVFYVDSTLKHDYLEMNHQMRQMHNSQVSNQALYTKVQDEWMAKIDESYKKIFTSEQWALYWKRVGQNAAKAREKRAQQEQKATQAGKK